MEISLTVAFLKTEMVLLCFITGSIISKESQSNAVRLSEKGSINFKSLIYISLNFKT